MQTDTDSLLEAANDWVKVIFLCSPNNPTGNNLSRDRLYKVLNTFQGIVVIDEAYSDFSIEPSFLSELDKFPNLIDTFSFPTDIFEAAKAPFNVQLSVTTY